MVTKNSDKTIKQLLIEGLSDAFGFVMGFFACYGVGTLLGFDMNVAGNTSTTGILLVGAMLICGGSGLKLARIWRNK